MNLLVFGGSGPTGRYLVRQALELGHNLTVVARSPDVLSAEIKHDNLTIVKGDATKQESFDEYMAGKDAVMSCLGAHASFWNHVSLYSEFAAEVQKSMEKHDVGRMVAMSSWGVRDDPNMSFFVRRLFLPFIRHILNDLLRMEEIFVKSTMNYTVVKAAGLKDGDPTDVELKVAVGREMVEECQYSIQRADVARFMLKCLGTNEYDRQALSVGLPK